VTEVGLARVCAIVVAYRPNLDVLRELLGALAVQVGAVLVVDNTDADEAGIPADFPGATAVLRQPENPGLARAQNAGIAWARQHGYPYVLFLDQDSLPGYGMVRALMDAHEALGTRTRVAAVGPRFRDLRDGQDAPFVRVRFPFNRLVRCEPGRPTVECDFLISSGTLVPMVILDDVGGMKEGLFIDNVDLEWSFRARSLGYSLHGVCAATMNHHLGDSRRSLPLGVGQVTVHGPRRLYYIMRNRVLLYRMRHTPAVWVAQDLPRLFAKLCLFGLLIGPRWSNARFMLRGLLDGWRGREGPCPLRVRG
jgi:rhamnosyltransferase